MSVPSYPFYSFLLKLPNKEMSFSFPLLKLPNKGREEYSKMIFRLRLEGVNRMGWKWIKRIILEYSSLSLFESFNGGNGNFILLFGSLSRRE